MCYHLSNRVLYKEVSEQSLSISEPQGSIYMFRGGVRVPVVSTADIVLKVDLSCTHSTLHNYVRGMQQLPGSHIYNT